MANQYVCSILLTGFISTRIITVAIVMAMIGFYKDPVTILTHVDGFRNQVESVMNSM